ncbi:hypothetical protein SASPL_146322 [Salvia splendens]|uniref:tyrosine--tRNA ligase n=1 Tax=Salvia splendens TaxID=180675 RepID=A0A8X8Z4S6_SALSN|nr:hypothetical protein SASPL_146322 [Salvia splendens]
MENEGSSSNSNEVPPSQPLQSLSISPQPQYDLIRSIGEECIQEDELERLLANKPNIVCYDGFEPSGRMHIAQGVMKAINVNKLTSAGCKVKIWIADWFAQLNNKMGGDLKKIQVIGQYLIEIWKAVGMNIEGGQVEFLWSSEEINSRAHEYWPLVMDIARRNKLPRVLRCCQIMGRSEQDELSAAQIFYPCMQCADIFFLKADICQLGIDQRKVNMLAREYCDDIKRKNKPIILSHHMLPGLQEGQEKMSKSDPSSSIFMEDEEADVNLKIKKAFCPPKVVEKNPCLEYIKYIVIPWFNEFTVERKPENGGDKTFKSFEDLVADYESGQLHPGDLKPALAKSLNRILQPVRDHFINDPKAKDLLKRVKFKVDWLQDSLGESRPEPLPVDAEIHQREGVVCGAPIVACLDDRCPLPVPPLDHRLVTEPDVRACGRREAVGEPILDRCAELSRQGHRSLVHPEALRELAAVVAGGVAAAAAEERALEAFGEGVFFADRLVAARLLWFEDEAWTSKWEACASEILACLRKRCAVVRFGWYRGESRWTSFKVKADKDVGRRRNHRAKMRKKMLIEGIVF